MAVHTHGLTSELTRAETGTQAGVVVREGVVAGLLGAGSLAGFFLVIDLIEGRPLYTPSMLGTALFGGSADASALREVRPSFEMTLIFTWVHALVFAVLGVAGARLLQLAERNPNLGFGVLLLFILFQGGFTFATALFAQGVVDALGLPAVLVGNLLAAGAMGYYFWLRHPGIEIRP